MKTLSVHAFLLAVALVTLALCGCIESGGHSAPPPPDAGPPPVCNTDAFACDNDRKTAVCNQYGLLNEAVCYDQPGPDPLPALAGHFPSYGCIAPTDENSGSDGSWMFWCCSKLTPGPVDDGCGGKCSNASCLPLP